MEDRPKVRLAKRGVGRPATGQGESVYVPAHLLAIVDRLKAGQLAEAIALIQKLP